MSAPYKPPAGPPPSAGVLAKYVLAYARASNLAEGRVRAWTSYMITAGMLERAAATARNPAFVIKGGVALELRCATALERQKTSTWRCIIRMRILQ